MLNSAKIDEPKNVPEINMTENSDPHNYYSP